MGRLRRARCVLVFGGLFLAPAGPAWPAARYFVRGDVNVDGAVNISDPILLLGFLFTGARGPSCEDAADENDDGALDLSDAVLSLEILFLGSAGPPPPAGRCGPDPTEDDRTCASFDVCRQPARLVKEGWVVRYDGKADTEDGARALALDSGGNVIVTGTVLRSGSGFDYATIKYDSTGKPLWTAFYDGPTSGSDAALALAIDVQGNVYVTGGSDGTSRRACTTVKYSPAGKEIWARRYDGPAGEDDFGIAIALDAAGNAYVTGNSGVNFSDSDYVALKYGPGGDVLWPGARYDGPAGGNDEAASIAVASSGDVYVTGRSVASGTGYDYATVKYGSNGQELWVARYDGPASGDDAAVALALDGQGNVLVTGSSKGMGTRLDYATVKYSSDKQQIWVRRFDGPVSGDDEASALAVDASGNVHVTGRIDHLLLCTEDGGLDDAARPGDYGTVKYDAAGNLLWVARYEGADRFSSASAKAIVLDGAGNVYVTGTDDHFFACDIDELEPTEDDYATLKYSPDGEELWLVGYDGAEHLDDGAVDIAVDAQGNVYVTGRAGSTLFSGGGDFATIQYQEAGN
jgi:hypothetical protein